MPLTEATNLVEGKAVAGLTVLRDPQMRISRQFYDVLSVVSGKMPTPIVYRDNGGASEKNVECSGPERPSNVVPFPIRSVR